MAIATTLPFRRIVGKVVRGVGETLSGTFGAIPLADARVTFYASIGSASNGDLVIFDRVNATTDSSANLWAEDPRQQGVPLLVSTDPSLGASGWTWTVEVQSSTMERPYRFSFVLPAGTDDIKFGDLMPVPENIGVDTALWQAAVEATATNAANALAYRNTTLSYRDQANTHRANAVTARTGAETAQAAAEAANNAAQATKSALQDAVMRAPSMIFNGGFELGGATTADGWTMNAAVVDRVAANAYRGSASMTLPQSSTISEVISDPAPTAEGRWVRLSSMYRTGSNSATLGGLRLQWSADGTTWNTLGAQPAVVHSSAWAYTEIRRQLPATALWVRARVAAAASSPTIRIDEVRLDDITELVAAETAAAAAQTAYNASTASLSVTGNTLTATRVNGTTYTVGTVTVPGPQGPAGKLTGNGGNMILDPNLQAALADNWTQTAGLAADVSKVTVGGAPGDAIRITGPNVRLKNINQIPVVRGESIWLGGLIQRATGSAGKAFLQIIERTPNATHNGARTVEIPIQNWGYYGGYVDIVNVGSTTYVEVEVATDANFTGQIWYSGIEARSVVRPHLIRASGLESIQKRSGRDVIFAGTSNVLPENDSSGWVAKLAASQGWTPRHYAVGGTGFTQNDAGGDNSFKKQLEKAAGSASIVNSEVGTVIIADSGNDLRSANSVATITTAVTDVFSYARAQFPNARIIFVPALWGPHTWNNDQLQWIKMSELWAAVRPIAAAQNIEWVEDSWLWHHGNTAAMRSGEVHYTALGHDIIAEFMRKHLRGESTSPVVDWTPIPGGSVTNSAAFGGWRGLSIRRDGAVGFIQGISRFSATATNPVVGVVPTNLRPTFPQEVHARVGNVQIVLTISENGNLNYAGSVTSSTTVTATSAYRID